MTAVGPDRFRVSPQLVERLRAHGVAPMAVAQRAGLPSAFFDQPRILVTTAELFALWRAVGESSRDPAIGLKLGAEPRLEHYSPTAIAAVCSRTFRDALQRMGRYKRLTCPEEILLRPARDGVAVEFAFLQAEDREPDVLVDVCLAWILGIGRRGTDGAVTPLRVELARPRPSEQHAALHERHYGCAVRFAARRNAVVFGHADIDRAFVTHNAELLGTVGAHLESELREQAAGGDVCDQVKRALKRSLAGKRPTLQHVALELGMGERTLQRRLTGAGSTFQQLVEDARRELARHYLKHSAVEFPELAYLLGYEDANSFFRAFHQWEGTTPGTWRAQHEQPAA